MTHVKKWLAMVLCLAMCFSMFPTCVLAEEDGAVTENYAETENFSPLSELPQKWEEPELPEIPEETETDGDTELAEEFNSIPEDEESAVTILGVMAFLMPYVIELIRELVDKAILFAKSIMDGGYRFQVGSVVLEPATATE